MRGIIPWLFHTSPRCGVQSKTGKTSANSIQSPHPLPTSSRSILILSSHLRLGLPSGLWENFSLLYVTKKHAMIYLADGHGHISTMQQALTWNKKQRESFRQKQQIIQFMASQTDRHSGQKNRWNWKWCTSTSQCHCLRAAHKSFSHHGSGNLPDDRTVWGGSELRLRCTALNIRKTPSNVQIPGPALSVYFHRRRTAFDFH